MLLNEEALRRNKFEREDSEPRGSDVSTETRYPTSSRRETHKLGFSLPYHLHTVHNGNISLSETHITRLQNGQLPSGVLRFLAAQFALLHLVLYDLLREYQL